MLFLRFIAGLSHNLSKLRLIVMNTILVLSIVTLALSAVYGKQLSEAPLDPEKFSYPKFYHWSTAWFVFYSSTMPFISLLYSIVDLCLLQMSGPNLFYVLVVFALTAGWATQVGFWFLCDFFPDSNTCYQFYVKSKSSSTAGTLEGVSVGVTVAKIVFGFVIPVLYMVYMILIAAALHERMMDLSWPASPARSNESGDTERGRCS